jgi:hypothetical protein
MCGSREGNICNLTFIKSPSINTAPQTFATKVTVAETYITVEHGTSNSHIYMPKKF